MVEKYQTLALVYVATSFDPYFWVKSEIEGSDRLIHDNVDQYIK
jgi:hypothetical protein